MSKQPLQHFQPGLPGSVLHHAASWVERTAESVLGGDTRKGEREERRKKKILCPQSAYNAESRAWVAPVSTRLSSPKSSHWLPWGSGANQKISPHTLAQEIPQGTGV